MVYLLVRAGQVLASNDRHVYVLKGDRRVKSKVSIHNYLRSTKVSEVA